MWLSILKGRQTQIIKKSERSEEELSACPHSQREYSLDGKIFKVNRYFTGDKDVNRVAGELARSMADRDFGLS